MVLSGVVLGLLLVNYLAWAVLQPVLEADPTEAFATTFWLAQVTSFLLAFVVCAFGFAPPIHVTCAPRALEVAQGERAARVPYDALRAVTPLPARLYHRHYRRYAAARCFVNRPDDELLLLRTGDGRPVVVGVPEGRRPDLMRAIAARRVPTYAAAPIAQSA